MIQKAPIVLALDTPDLQTALSWVRATESYVSVFKVGLEFFLNFGSEGFKKISAETDNDIFLDLKLHDIPHTVAGATKAIKDLQPMFLTVHASGGSAMIRAAVEAAPEISITAVTVLTSLSAVDVAQVGFTESALTTAVGMAKLAVDAGAKALVCSPHEIAAIRSQVGMGPVIITPGVRPEGSAGSDDQSRTMTPVEAISLGANLVVIGRPITQSWANGASAMRNRAAEIASQLI